MNKIVTSFDIGIKNLAYCSMEYMPSKPPGDQFLIHDWNVLNLLEDEGTINKNCQAVFKTGIKSGKTCPNKAHFYTVNTDGEKISVCRTHSKSYSPDQLKRVFTCANISIFELASLAVKELDKIDFTNSDEIIIESQPNKNPVMKNLSMMILNYFVLRYVVEKGAKIQDITFISAKNKLKVYDGPYVECKLKNQYSRNKFYGKIYCRHMIRGNSKWLNFFEAHKKKDDLADSALMLIWYLMNNYRGDNC